MSDADNAKTLDPESKGSIKKPEKFEMNEASNQPEVEEQPKKIEKSEKPEAKKAEKPIKIKEPQKSGKGFFGIIFGFLTLVLWIVVIAVGTMPWWINNPHIPSEVKTYIDKIPFKIPALNQTDSGDLGFIETLVADLQNKVEQLEQTTLDNLTKRVEQLEINKEFAGETLDTTPDSEKVVQPNNTEELDVLKADFANLTTKFDLLSDKTKNVETSLTNLEKKEAVKTDKTKTEVDLKSIENVIERRDQALAVIATVSLLEDAFNYGTPYNNELELLKNILLNSELYEAELTLLEKYASSGIKPLARLIKDFNDIAPEAAWASLKIPQEGGVAGKVIAKLKSLVSFRRMGDKAPENSTENIIYNAEKLINLGSINDALKELEKISDQDAITVITPWLEDAKAFVDVKAVLRKMIMNLVENASKPL